MQRTHSWRVIRDDRLVKIWRTENGKFVRQGKRVTKACPIDYTARRLYVMQDAPAAVRYLMNLHGFGLAQAYALFKLARDYTK